MKDVVQLVMDDEMADGDDNPGASFIKQKRGKANAGKKKEDSPTKITTAGKQSGKKPTGRKAKMARDDQAA
jgi:hypothetical protein